MKKVRANGFKLSFVSFLAFFLLIAPGCQKILDNLPDLHNHIKPKLIGNFNQVNLVSNTSKYNPAVIDPLLINGWGIAFSRGGTPWVGSQGGHVSTIYNSEGAIAGISPVGIPSPGGPTGGNPTGVVFNGVNSDFILSNGQAATFLFVGVDGVISGWNGAAGRNALLIKNNSATSAYTGLAIASEGTNQFLYAANFRARTIDVFDRTFNQVTNKPFVDPYLPAGYSPFNIQAIGNQLYVMYAKVGPDGRDVPGVGNGVVDIYTTGGVLVKRFASRGELNSPWGVAQAPAGFFDDNSDGPDENAILIGNFGDGRINAYGADGTFLGQLSMNNKPIVIEGLWAIMFPPATATTIDPNRLYFAAGPDEEENGLFGYLIKK
ncbi:MAG: TIGR03118 family protein [Bacteroidota bacterium]|nr:TIGR03118 family protein [Bacteroidota bacterium]